MLKFGNLKFQFAFNGKKRTKTRAKTGKNPPTLKVFNALSD
jgi:hypothetical protein